MSETTKFFTGAAGLSTALAALILMIVISSAIRIRLDMTSEKLYTLSDVSLATTNSLTRDVTLRLYFNYRSQKMPQNVKQYGKRVMDLLKEYRDSAQGKILLEIIDPNELNGVDSPIKASEAKPFREAKSLEDTTFYLGLTARSGKYEESIQILYPSEEQSIEYSITKLIKAVAQPNKPKVGLINGATQQITLKTSSEQFHSDHEWRVFKELKKSVELIDLSSSIKEIDEEIKVLMLVHPQQLPDPTLFAIDQYILKGGKAFVFLDPKLSISSNLKNSKDTPPGAINQSEINRLSSAWGVTLATNEILETKRVSSATISSQEASQQQIISFEERMSNKRAQDKAPSANGIIEMRSAGYFLVKDTEGISVTPLLSKIDNSKLSTNELPGNENNQSPFTKSKDAKFPYVAVELTGRFKSAFPSGNPDGSDKPNTQPSPAKHQQALAVSTSSNTIVMIADTDLLTDELTVESMIMAKSNLLQETTKNKNIDFVISRILSSLGDESLEILGDRKAYERPMSKLEKMHNDLKSRWHAAEIDIASKTLKLHDLTLDSSLYKEEQAKVIQAEISKQKRELSELKRTDNLSYESYTMKIKIFNFVIAPLILLAYGLVRARQRKQRRYV